MITINTGAAGARGGGAERVADRLHAGDTGDAVAALGELRAKLEDHRRQEARRSGWTPRFVPTGLVVLDAVLPHGGLPCGGVTEILADEPGAGSMALALRIANRCVVGGRRPDGRHPAGLSTGRTDGRDHPFERDSTGSEPRCGNTGQCQICGTSFLPRRAGSTAPDVPGSSSGPATCSRRDEARHLLVGPPCPSRQAPPERVGPDHRFVVMVDAWGDFYPPAACQHGLPLDRLIVIRTTKEPDAFWAADQALRCPAVGVVIVMLTDLDERLSRRLQLAAESSGCLGLVLRTGRRFSKSFAAVRVLVDKPSASPRFSHAGVDGLCLCRLTVLKVREGTPAGPLLVDLHHETGAGPLHPVPVDRSAAKLA